MRKKTSRQILAENLERLMARYPGLGSNHALGIKAKVAHSHIRKIRLQESAATVDALDQIADAFGIHPFELLTDGEAVREAALARAMWGQPVPDEHVAKHLPPAPSNKPAIRTAAQRHRRKPPGKKDDTQRH